MIVIDIKIQLFKMWAYANVAQMNRINWSRKEERNRNNKKSIKNKKMTNKNRNNQ